jgi:hypothetical protein
MSLRPWFAFGWLVWLAGTLVGLPLQGQDFRVDTEVFIGDEKEASIETLTIFSNGRVYDFLLHQREVTFFDPHGGRFVFLDEQRRLKAGISTQQVLQFAIELEAHAAESKDPLFAFAARPKFETTFEDVMQNGQSLVRIKLAGKPLEYTALGHKPQHADAARVYRHFADWYARLNATRAGNLPPGARLELNQALAERSLLPLEVTRTIPATSPLGKKVVTTSRHLVNWSLSGEDRRRIDDVGTWMASFASVSFDEYRAQQPGGGNKQAKR